MLIEGYDSEDLAATLLRQLKNLAHGNQVDAQEVQEVAHEAEAFTVELNVVWRFSGDIEERRIAGGEMAARHCGEDMEAFERETAALLHQAQTGTALRQPFINGLSEAGRQGLAQSLQETVFHRFAPLSVQEDCPLCQGKGRTTCRRCGGVGRQTCTTCGGAGQHSEQVPEYRDGQYSGSRTVQHVCETCSGSGQMTCADCVGAGAVRCEHCGGHGFFMLTRDIAARAAPEYTIGTTTRFAHDVLDALLMQEGPDFCRQKIPLDLTSHCPNGVSSHLFAYSGRSIALRLDFTLNRALMKGNTYTCYAFANPPHPYVRPAFFDDLFALELDWLADAVPLTGIVKRSKAVAFFYRHAGQPVLDNVLRDMARTPDHSAAALAAAMKKACQGFISTEMAEELAAYLNRILDKVSPTHAAGVWWLFAAPTLLYATLYAEAQMETHFADRPFFAIFDTAVRVVLMVVIPLGIAWLGSTLLTLYRRSKVPREYWQELRDGIIMRRLLRTARNLGIAAALYGALAAHDLVPRTDSVWLNNIRRTMSEDICPYMPTRGCENLFRLPPEPPPQPETVPEPATTETAAEVTVRPQAATAQATVLDEREKARRIQQFLARQGYQLTVDGHFGAQSRRAADDYLRHGSDITLDATATIEDYYRAVFGLPPLETEAAGD